MVASENEPAHRMSRPACELLLACARTEIKPETKDRIAVLVRQIEDWDDFIATGMFHNVLPLVYRSLNQFGPGSVPAAKLQALKRCFHGNTQRSLYLTGALIKLLKRLEEAGVAALPFKGPTLASVAYNNLALRQFGDLDILVHRQDFEKAKDIIVAHGFRPWRELTKDEEAAHLRSEHAFAFVGEHGQVNIDLHWRITQNRYSFGLDPEYFWNRVERLSLGGMRIPSLRREDLLLLLCVHGSKHCWERLAWICDVAELVRANPGLAWDEILTWSRALSMERALFLGLALAQELLDAPVPREVLSRFKHDREVKFLVSLVRKRLISGRRRPLTLIERTVLYLAMRERLRNKIPYCFYSFRVAVTPNGNDRSLIPLPPALYFLYYPLRVMRLTTASAFDALARLFSRAS